MDDRPRPRPERPPSADPPDRRHAAGPAPDLPHSVLPLPSASPSLSLRPRSARRRFRVAVLACDPASPLRARADEDFDYPHAEASDRAFLAALADAGYEVSWHPVHLGNVDATVEAIDADVVFNLCDGSGPGRDNYPGTEAIEALERRGLPYTGSRLTPYRIAISKSAMKERFAAAQVPTPQWRLVRSEAELEALTLFAPRCIVKPNDAGGSAGVMISSIVDRADELRERAASIVADYGGALIEEYVDGREITVGLLGHGSSTRALPPLEVKFGAAFPEGKGIRTHDTKWDPTSPLYCGFDLLCPAPMTPSQTRRVLRVAREAYRSIEGAGYGRVDMRVDARGPWVLEVNMNCSLEYGESIADCGMYPYAARSAGIPFSALLRRLVEDARRLHARANRTAATTRRARAL